MLSRTRSVTACLALLAVTAGVPMSLSATVGAERAEGKVKVPSLLAPGGRGAEPPVLPCSGIPGATAVAGIAASPAPASADLLPQDPPPIVGCWDLCNERTSAWLKKRIAEGNVPTLDALMGYLAGCLDLCMNPPE